MPSYYWAGPGYGDYDSPTFDGFISADRISDLSSFGTFFPGEIQTALNQYDTMVANSIAAANAQYFLDQFNASGGTDTGALQTAVSYLAGHNDVGISINGSTYYGDQAAQVLGELHDF